MRKAMNGTHITTDLFLLRCLTNAHVGSGDTTYGIVDKIVQRDPITEFPVIHSSGIKGAFRELLAFLKNPDEPLKGHRDSKVEEIFGSAKINPVENKKEAEEKEKNAAPQFTQGTHLFYEAHLLVLPVRSNVRPFFRATSPERLQEFLEKVELYISPEKQRELEGKLKPLLDKDNKVKKGAPRVFIEEKDNNTLKNGNNVILENGEWPVEIVKKDVKTAEEILGKDIALLHDDDLKTLCRELPVIARNNLENGISVNLWYEEVVPRETRFYSFLSYPIAEDVSKLWDELNNLNWKQILQVGGNATIGYGICEIIKMEWNSHEKQTGGQTD